MTRAVIKRVKASTAMVVRVRVNCCGLIFKICSTLLLSLQEDKCTVQVLNISIVSDYNSKIRRKHT